MKRIAISVLMALSGCVDMSPTRICHDGLVYVDRQSDGVYTPVNEPYGSRQIKCVPVSKESAGQP